MKIVNTIMRRHESHINIAIPTVFTLMDLSKEKRNAIQKLKVRMGNKLPPALNTEYELYKFLQARNFNVDKAQAMMEKSVIYRKEWEINSLLSWNAPEVLSKYSPCGMSGLDKEGSPVWIVPYGYCDIKGILHSSSSRDYIRYQLKVLERSLEILRRRFEETGEICKQTCIFDMENYSMKYITWKPSRDAILELVQIYEENYPELLKCCYIINAPRIFSAAMVLVKPFLQQETLDKIKIFGTSGWKSALLEQISADQFPAHYGGSQVDPDGNPKCPSKICLGGEVPQSYYLKNRKLNANDQQTKMNDLETIVLPNGGKECLKLEVETPASILKWEFFTEDFDVGFGVCRLLPNDETDFVIPISRVNCQLVPEEGSLSCADPGTYEVTFDNEYSYLRSKTVYYKVEVIAPSENTHF